MGKKRLKQRLAKRRLLNTAILMVAVLLVGGSGFGAYHLLLAAETPLPPIYLEIDPNLGLEQQVIEFFTDNDAAEMIPIIDCESNFRHFDADGSVLKNKAGSSATGIAQILHSKHPDPKIVYRYNKRHNTDLEVADLDITTVAGNLGYALMLYEINGTRDWECAKPFRFR